jgi:hypothetical protein
LIIIEMIRIVVMIIDDGAVLVAPLDSQRKPSRLSPALVDAWEA